MMEVTLLVAFAAGMLAVFSPCSALLLPSFFAYAFTTRSKLVGRTMVFYLGLLIVLVPLGVGSSAASSLVYANRETTIKVAGGLIIGLGIWQLLGKGFTLPFGNRLQQVTAGVDARRGVGSTLVLGAVYGLAGFCSGPILGAILTMAATSGSSLGGGLLLAAYALGMAAPLLVLALLWDRFDLGSRPWLRGRGITVGPITTHSTSLISGLLFISIGVLFIRFDGMVGLTSRLGLGDTTEFEFAAQQKVTDWFGAIPGWVTPAVIAVVALLVAWRRSRTPGDEVPDSEVTPSQDRTSPPPGASQVPM